MPNPAHFLMGWGKLFAYAEENARDVAANGPVTNIVAHQCTDYHASNWSQTVFELLTANWQKSGMWRSPNQTGIFMLSWNGDGKSYSPDSGDLVVCAKDFVAEPATTGLYLGRNLPPVIGQWHHTLTRLGKMGLRAATPPGKLAHARHVQHSMGAGAKVHIEGCNPMCTKALRVALWQRAGPKSEGTSRRHNCGRNIRNTRDVADVVAKYSVRGLRLVTADHVTTWDAQAGIFQGTDILISPHGSQLANMVFAHPNLTVLELVSGPIQDIFCVNGNAFLTSGRALVSAGHGIDPCSPGGLHLGASEDWSRAVQRCLGPRIIRMNKTMCPKKVTNAFHDSGVCVSPSIFEIDFVRSIQAACGCSTFVPRKLEFECNNKWDSAQYSEASISPMCRDGRALLAVSG